MTTTESTGFDLLDAYTRDHALELSQDMLERDRVVHTQKGYWLISRYDDVKKAFSDAESLSSAVQMEEFFGLPTDFDPATDHAEMERLRAVTHGTAIEVEDLISARPIAFTDPPRHIRHRRRWAPALSRRRVEAMIPEVDGYVARYIAGIDTATRFDVVDRLARRLPLRVIAALLGVGEEHDAYLTSIVDEILATATGPDRGPEGRHRMLENHRKFAEFFSPLIEERRANPGEDIISDVVRLREDDDADSVLNPAEMLFDTLNVLMAGNDSTRLLIGNTVIALMRHPDQLQAVIDHPDYVPNAVESVLHYRPSLLYSMRVAVKPYRVGDVVIPEGAVVGLVIGAANRDPAQFARPDTFDVTSDQLFRGHLGFGHGIHTCVGNHLARMEAASAIRGLLPHLPDYELDESTLVPQEGLVEFGYNRIELVRRRSGG